MNTTEKATKKSIKTKLADPDTYLDIIADCMSDEQKDNLSPHHIANIMALSAEMLLTYAGPIGKSFQDQGELDVTLKARLGTMKDTVQIQFKRAADFKDSASAELPDPNQTEMDFKGGKKPGKQAGPSADDEIEDDDLPITMKALPAPMMGLPAPDDDDVIDVSDESGEEGVA